MQRVLILGASGLIGSHLASAFSRKHVVYGTHHRRRPPLPNVATIRLDVSDQKKLVDLIRFIKPDVTYYCIGVADEDFCQKHTTLADLLNVRAATLAAEAATSLGGQFVYFSSSKVFSGDEGAYTEDHITRPITLYGGMKVQAENTLANFPRTLVLRLGNIFGLGLWVQSTSLSRMIAEIRQDKRMSLICDEYRSFYSVREVVTACEVLMRLPDPPGGLFHLSNRERSSYFDFGRLLTHILRLPEKSVHAIAGKDFDNLRGTPVPRGHDLSLDGSRFEKVVGAGVGSASSGLEYLRYQLANGAW